MSFAGFVILALMLVAYVILDGYDLGVGAVSYFITRDKNERAAAVAAIGPYWSGNEVWLIAAGGVLFAFFPRAYASSFSGFYLPFMVLLWLLMFRGIALELRGHLDHDLWHDFWDVTFALSSTLLAVIFGVALGNLLRGFPLGSSGYFTGSFALLLNPYALGVGIFALLAVAQHGVAFLAAAGHRPASARLAPLLWWLVLASDLAITAATFVGRPIAGTQLIVAGALGFASFVALIAVRLFTWGGQARAAFAASCTFLAALLAAAAATLFPFLVPASDGAAGISIYNASPSGAPTLAILVISVVALIAIAAYTLFVTRSFAHAAETQPE